MCSCVCVQIAADLTGCRVVWSGLVAGPVAGLFALRLHTLISDTLICGTRKLFGQFRVAAAALCVGGGCDDVSNRQHCPAARARVSVEKRTGSRGRRVHEI